MQQPMYNQRIRNGCCYYRQSKISDQTSRIYAHIRREYEQKKKEMNEPTKQIND